MMPLIATYEDEQVRANLRSTHAFPVSIAKRRDYRYLEAFYTDRKQCRSRAGVNRFSNKC
ncbi:hypothetical protein F441_18168 [Phytophthora nicotianae CJ01A1]|uniref:Uncharacterized protein n=5 Tax=Phytophthora nicotianae TaxID=4792 RepID=W2R7G6_PHYN3|nr:hypothetical protein PPTG_21344 [Phytophthora nicotianae INRA-310]ETK75602.1 hypothetical protein L915_17819 [Phytophthora nicotianae]ETN20649.1 hypothetical protein PPTG_21344 [Phytophthora nicotianae INRA-310]ETO64098.1 hypothetical protein F444_18319 [Phytophthora nicotianae P1976]ETP05186.1 hypothetical protein F441_18168 [Phytophthora nicotianae CJ01A1]